MRKILYILPPIALLLCLALVLMMTGVLNLPEITQSPSTTQSASGTTTTSPSIGSTATGDHAWIRQNMFSISLPEMTETIVSEDGVTLFRRVFQDVVLSTPNPKINKAVTLDLLQRMDSNAATAGQLADLVQYYTPGTAWNTIYYEILYNPTRIDGSVLSLQGIEAVYSGSGQASYSTTCVNYYMTTGGVMTLSEILSEESGAQEGLLQALLTVLAQNAKQWELFEDYSEPVIRYFQSYLQQESIWFFSPEGLNICFAPYEIAPYSSGTVVATIPYESLTGILRSDLFPAKQSQAAGSVEILDFAAAPLEKFSHFSECILTADGKNHLITTDSILYDVRLELGTYQQDIGSFTPSSTVFAANSLCSDQAIRLCWNPDSQQLLLRCTIGGEAKNFLLTVDADGKVELKAISLIS